MPVSFENFATSSSSRVCDLPTGPSPRNVMLRPPYFALIAFAFGTFGGLMACTNSSADAVTAVPALPAAVMASEATSAKAPMDPTPASNARRFTFSRPF